MYVVNIQRVHISVAHYTLHITIAHLRRFFTYSNQLSFSDFSNRKHILKLKSGGVEQRDNETEIVVIID